MSRKKYKSAAEKQKAYRLRHGQKRKVPLEIRRGIKLGSQEGDLRAKKEGETWEEYKLYIDKAIKGSRAREKGGVAFIPKEGQKPGVSGELDEGYYEIQHQHEKSLEKLGEGKKVRRRRKQK